MRLRYCTVVFWYVAPPEPENLALLDRRARSIRNAAHESLVLV
jgi:hypothetical protein